MFDVLLVIASSVHNCAKMETTARFDADNWNKLKNLASKVIGEKMKVNTSFIYRYTSLLIYLGGRNITTIKLYFKLHQFRL